MKKNLLLLASIVFAFFFLSSCAEIKEALMENCHLYSEVILDTKITIKCEENIPIGTCAELASKVPSAKYETVPSCSDISSSSSGS